LAVAHSSLVSAIPERLCPVHRVFCDERGFTVQHPDGTGEEEDWGSIADYPPTIRDLVLSSATENAKDVAPRSSAARRGGVTPPIIPPKTKRVIWPNACESQMRSR
jgi:hypothetical protein